MKMERTKNREPRTAIFIRKCARAGMGVCKATMAYVKPCLTAKTLTGAESARLQESVSRVMQKQGLEGDTLIRELRRALQPATARP